MTPLLTTGGGSVVLPDAKLVLVDRRDGGNLIVNPPRDVWERSELTAAELIAWSCLVAATGRAMLDVLPQLDLCGFRNIIRTLQLQCSFLYPVALRKIIEQGYSQIE